MCKYCTAGKTNSWAVYQTSITIQLKASALSGITKNGKGYTNVELIKELRKSGNKLCCFYK